MGVRRDAGIQDDAEVISYKHLYHRWEQNPWSALDIDFTIDADHWQSRLSEEQRRAALWNYAMFLVGEEAVARTLTPLIDAAPSHEIAIFLTTQIVDESRHHVFFDRFLREVATCGRDTTSTLEEAHGYLTWGFRRVFDELDRVTDELRRTPKELPLLAKSVALYQIVVEGTLAITSQHFIQRYVERLGVLPGFSFGIDNVSRDESRHVAFGVKLLHDLNHHSSECRAAVVELWQRVLPWALGVFVPPDLDPSFAESLGFTLEEIYAFGTRSFETKVRRTGIDPQEIPLLGLDDPSRSYDERAQRMWSLIRTGVMGDDSRKPEPDEEALTVLFDGMARSIRPEVARAFDGPIQWEFTDGRTPRHLVLVNGTAHAVPGAAAGPRIRLRSSSADLARLALGRADPRRLVFSGRLRVHGPAKLKLRLSRLFEIPKV